MSIIEEELKENQKINESKLLNLDNEDNDDDNILNNKSYIFNNQLHIIVEKAFRNFYEGIPDNYDKKEEIKETLTRIGMSLSYHPWEIKVHKYARSIMCIPNLLPHDESESSLWAVKAWKILTAAVPDMEKHIKDNLNLSN